MEKQMDTELLIWLLESRACSGHVKRAAGGISISPRSQASTKQAALPDATSALALTVFRVEDTLFSSFGKVQAY